MPSRAERITEKLKKQDEAVAELSAKELANGIKGLGGMSIEVEDPTGNRKTFTVSIHIDSAGSSDGKYGVRLSHALRGGSVFAGKGTATSMSSLQLRSKNPPFDTGAAVVQLDAKDIRKVMKSSHYFFTAKNILGDMLKTYTAWLNTGVVKSNGVQSFRNQK